MDWSKVFINELDWTYAAEIGLRTLIMFVLVLLLLRLSGKKGVRQLSLFEVAIIISFGSAAGDPMFNQDIAIVPCLLVLLTIIAIYRIITWAVMKWETVESVFEGDPEYIIEDGLFVLKHEDRHTFAKDEFLSEMRQQNIEHLGQVRTAILETNGTVSFFFFADDKVQYGMPVLPKPYGKMNSDIPIPGKYACTYCGCVEELTVGKKCSRCNKQSWVKAINTLRIT